MSARKKLAQIDDVGILVLSMICVNPSVERTRTGRPGQTAHVKRYVFRFIDV